MKILKGTTLFALPLLLVACGNDDLDTISIQAPDVYEFTSLLDPSAISSVDYKEATTQLILINELDHFIASDALQVGNSKEDALSKMNSLYKSGTQTFAINNLLTSDIYSTENKATELHGLTLDSNIEQANFSQLAGDINLQNNMAGIAQDLNLRDDEDESGLLGNFIGWFMLHIDIEDIDNNLIGDGTSDGDDHPNALIQHWITKIAELASDSDDTTNYIYGSSNYRQLLHTFLLGSVAYSQAANLHLNADIGLLMQNSTAHNLQAYTDGTTDQLTPYTSLEHNWDMAFGYFGAARDYNNYTDEHIISQPDNDSNGDEQINVYSEINFTFAINATERDASAPLMDISFSEQIMQAFLNGRQIIQDNFGQNPIKGSGYHQQLLEQSRIILTVWDRIIAATIIHQINVTAVQVSLIEKDDYDHLQYIEDWAKLKSLSMALQFNPLKALNIDEITTLHQHIHSSPKTKRTDVSPYLKALGAARALMQNQYNFSDRNTSEW